MSVVVTEVRPGAYVDSVVLMQLQSDLERLTGVVAAGVVMGTATNLDLLRASELLDQEGELAGAEDLVVAVRADSEASARQALARVDSLLLRGRGGDAGEYRPRTLGSALRLAPGATWVSISVPGRYAGSIAREALSRDLHVFLYSDNVPIEEEVELKHLARTRGRLLLGPDCGSAILGGVGFGFTNVVRSGPIGLVCASGTGLQALASAIHRSGSGISQAIGTGGRDLSRQVGGVTARQALELLAGDPATAVIVLASKPPDPEIGAELLGRAMAIDKPVVVAFTGFVAPARRIGNLHFAHNLTEAAALAVEQLQQDVSENRPRVPRVNGFLRGLFTGGTLALEAIQTAAALLVPLHSNLAAAGATALPEATASLGHAILDLGADEYTVGRLHPMIDSRLRLQRLHQEAADPGTGLLLLDLVLGRGAHQDPAGELVPAVEKIGAAGGPPIVVVVVGTEDDAQGLAETVERLAAAGAHVFLDVAEGLAAAVEACVAATPSSASVVDADCLTRPAAVINVGLESQLADLRAQEVEAIQVDWRPPAGGDEKLMAILERMKR